jgi:cell division protein FtsZ
MTVQFVPVTELTEMELSNILLKNTWIQNQMAKPVAKTQKFVVPAGLNITMKQVDTAVNTAVDFDYFSMEDNRESLVE